MSKQLVIIMVLLFSFQYLKLLSNDNYEIKPPTASVYVESTFFFSCSINAEYFLSKNLSLTTGIGFSQIQMYNDYQGKGVQTKINYMTNGNHKFEIDGGFSYISEKRNNKDFGWKLYPAGFIGYRYQPDNQNIFIRAGANISYAFGWPIAVSLGFVF